MNGVYDRIRRLRIANGLTLEELARAVGYKGRSMMSQVELGKVDLPLTQGRRHCAGPAHNPSGTAVPASPPEKGEREGSCSYNRSRQAGRHG